MPSSEDRGWVGLLTPLKIDQGFRMTAKGEILISRTDAGNRQTTKTNFYPEETSKRPCKVGGHLSFQIAAGNLAVVTSNSRDQWNLQMFICSKVPRDAQTL